MPSTEQPVPPPKPARKTGVAHFVAAAGYSAAGLRRALRESAFRQEAALGVIALVILVVIGASLGHFVAQAMLWLVMLAFEAVNTAIEALVDRLSPDWSEFARDTKDLASLGVAALIVANALYFAYIVWAVVSG